MMILLISTMLTILAQNPAAAPAEVAVGKAWFDGAGGSALIDLSEIELSEGRVAAHLELLDCLQLKFAPGAKDAASENSVFFAYLQPPSRIAGTPVASDGDFLHWQTTFGELLKIDLCHVVAIARAGFVKTTVEKDSLRLLNSSKVSDSLNGFFVGLSDNRIKFEAADAMVEVQLEQLDELVFWTDRPEDKALPSMIYLSDGSAFCAAVNKFDDNTLFVSTLWQDVLALGIEKVSKVVSNNVAQLSFETKLEATSVDGYELSISGDKYNQGWSRLPNEIIRFKSLKDGLFAIWVGIDDDVKGFRAPSPVVFSVFVNNKLRQSSVAKKFGQSSQLLRIKLQENDTVELRSSAVYESSSGAHGDWCQPVFIPFY